MATRAIITHQPEVSCDMCGRRLLRGERPDVFLAAGSRRTVCELCVPRAAGEGWLRESEALAATGPRASRARRGRSLFDRLRQRRGLDQGSHETDDRLEPWSEGSHDAWQDAPVRGWTPHEQEQWPQEHDHLPAGDDVQFDEADGAFEHERSLPAMAQPAASATVSAGLSSDLTAEQAIEIFNASECSGRVAGIARALGQPTVNVRQHEHSADRVTVVVAWELCWYRYEVDLGERPATIALLGDGTELDELPPQDKLANAAADERGELSLLR